jgi:hypothetical protein
MNPGRKADMGESASVHSIEVTITPAHLKTAPAWFCTLQNAGL